MAVKVKHRLGDQSARINSSQTVQYLHATFSPSDIPQTGVTTAAQTCKFKLGVLPAYAMPLETYVRVNVAATANVLVVGSSSGSKINDVVSTSDVLGATTGTYVVDKWMGTLSTVDQALYVATITTGCTGPNNGGQFDIWQAYIPVNQPATL